MGQAIAQKLVKLLIANGVSPCRARVGVMGLTFKQDVPDIRNSKVPDILAELREYGIALCEPEELLQLDALVLAVNHAA
ncbi:UDP binding domain-containing protein [Erythrobacter dokdonensis]|nr:UDP binding domain-containing protein [Erythrobacter dokdonensis]